MQCENHKTNYLNLFGSVDGFAFISNVVMGGIT